MSTGSLAVGCRYVDAAWLAVAVDDDGVDGVAVVDGIGEIWQRYEEAAESILVDVPIGLVDEGSPERPPDAAARAVLGPRADAVTDPPVREAVRKRRYPAADRVHERKTGRPLSEGAFARSPGIAAVDELLREVSAARSVVAEANPEVCYRAFAGATLERDPETAGGYAERMRALATFERDAPPMVQDAAEGTDDADVTVRQVLDAVALALTARPGAGSLYTLPADPVTDSAGLPMAITYRAAAPLDGAGTDEETAD